MVCSHFAQMIEYWNFALLFIFTHCVHTRLCVAGWYGCGDNVNGGGSYCVVVVEVEVTVVTTMVAATAAVVVVFAHSFVHRFSPFSISARWIFAVCYCYHLAHSIDCSLLLLFGFIFPLRVFWITNVWQISSFDWIFFLFVFFECVCVCFHIQQPISSIYLTHKKQQLIFFGFLRTLPLHFTSFRTHKLATGNWYSKYEKLVPNYSFSWFFRTQKIVIL